MNKFKEGDLVEILPLTEIEKKRYPPTWMPEMRCKFRYTYCIRTILGRGNRQCKNSQMN